MRTDFENLKDGVEITLFPSGNNPLHKTPVKAVYAGGYFYCAGSPKELGPDYYLGDVLTYCDGFEVA